MSDINWPGLNLCLGCHDRAKPQLSCDGIDFREFDNGILRQPTERLRMFDQRVHRHYRYADEERELPHAIRNP